MTTSSTSVPTIQVGGNFRMGDASGQIAIGDNISQIQIIYNDCVFVLPDGSTVHGKSWSYIQGIRPSTGPDNIFGRQQELEKIDELFNPTSALAITGFKGTGKSTLASMYIDRLEKKGEFAGIFWRKMDETVDITDVVGSFFSVIGKPIKDIGFYKIEDQLNLLFRELNDAPYFLVLDNLEILLDPKTNKPIKAGFSDLIEKANGDTGRSRILFTSWECPSSERGIRPNYYTIGGLDDSAAIQLLRNKGLTESDNELKRAIELCGGHPLALILLVQLVIGEEESFSSILEDNTLWIGGEVAENILDKVYKERLSEIEQKLLQYLSLYRAPVPLQGIVFAANDQEWSETVVKKLALQLKRKSLLQKTEEDYWGESLINIYAYNKLNDKVEHHKLACEYYLSLPLPEERTRKEDIQPLIEAHYHACRAKEYDLAASIIFDYNLWDYLDRWGNYGTLVELYSGVLPKDQIKDNSLLTNVFIYSNVLGKLGEVYYLQGQGEKSLEYHEKALKISREIGDKRREGIWRGNIGKTYNDLGQIEKAIYYFEKAIEISKEIGERPGEGIWLGNLGAAYSNLDQIEKAIDYYEKALEISREFDDRQNEGAWLGNLGVAYSNLGQIEKAIDYYEKALEISREFDDRHNEGVWLGNLGRDYYLSGKIEKSFEYCDKALAISKEIGDKRSEGNHLGNLGNVFIDLNKIEKAIEYYNLSLGISREIGDKRSEGTRLGNLGNAYFHLGQTEKAMEFYKGGLKVAREIGDIRGEGNLLGNLSVAYYIQEQVEKSIVYCKKALIISRDIKDKRTELTLLGNLGLAYNNLGRLRKAIEYYENALTVLKEIDDKHTEKKHLRNLGIAYIDLEEFEKAIDCFENELILTTKIDNDTVDASTLRILGMAYGHMGQVERAIEYYEKAIVISKEIGDKKIEGECLKNFVKACRDLQPIEKAIECYERAFLIAKEIDDKKIKGVCFGCIGNAYEGLGKFETAIGYYKKTLVIAREIKNRRCEGIVLGNLGNSYSDLGF